MRGRLLLAACALVVLGGACSQGDDGGAARLVVDGRAEVAPPDGEAEEERGSRSVKFGERVKVLEGTAVLDLGGDRELELRVGSNVVLQEAKEGDGGVAQPFLLENDVLVQAPSGDRLTVSTEGAEVVVSGGAQISRRTALIVSSYEGAVELRSGEQTATVPALRQISVPAGGPVPDRPSALSYEADDSWDRRFLSEAIELGNELEARSKGFSAQIDPTEGRTPEFLIRLLPALGNQPEFSASLFDALRPPGEALVGSAIALEGTRGTFAERWAGVFGFRQDGANWGLVALDQGVSRTPLLAQVDAAIGRGPRAFDPVHLTPPPDDGEVALPGGPGNGSSGSGGSTATTAAVGGGPRPSVAVPTTVSPPTPPNPNVGPVNTGIPVLDNTINALVETLSGLLRSLGQA